MALDYSFIKIEAFGSLALTERPKLKEIKSLSNDGCTVVVTILAERGEQALRIGHEVNANSMSWEWVKVKNAVKMEPSEKILFKRSICKVVGHLRENGNIIVHCSAGLHRTGIFAFCLLKKLGLQDDDVLEYIKRIRLKTFEALEPKYREIALELS